MSTLPTVSLAQRRKSNLRLAAVLAVVAAGFFVLGLFAAVQ